MTEQNTNENQERPYVDVCRCGRAKDSIWHYFTDRPRPGDLGAHKFEFSHTSQEWREDVFLQIGYHGMVTVSEASGSAQSEAQESSSSNYNPPSQGRTTP